MCERKRNIVQTFGCRLNIWESEVMRNQAFSAGLKNALVFNTCAVTAEAEKQARRAIRKARRENPEVKIIVTGCAAQINPKNWIEMPEVDQVLGNHDKLRPESWAAVVEENAPSLLVTDIMEIRETASHMVESFDRHTRAFLQIQQGCDHRCTFCIIPYGRGNNRSAGLKEVIGSAKKLVSNGCKELVLTGVDIMSWGTDLPGRPRLGRLVSELLLSLPALRRLRLSSLDPAKLDFELLEILGDDERLLPYIHLSAQHGDDLILKRMKRRHLLADLLKFCSEARRRRPDVVFGADLIAGFPTESDGAHAANLAMIEDAGITHLHVFPFSPRQGTAASKMPQVERSTIKARAQELRLEGSRRLNSFLEAAIGSTDQLLVEANNRGRSRNFSKVRLDGLQALPGEIIDIKIVGREGDNLVGRPRELI